MGIFFAWFNNRYYILYLIYFVLSHHLQAETIWLIGENNGSYAEFEPEEGGDMAKRIYYYENGDYSSQILLATGAVDWAAGQEVLSTTSSGEDRDGDPGMPRALSTGAAEIHILFQLTADEVSADKLLRYSTSGLEPRTENGLASTHDVHWSLGGHVFHVEKDYSGGPIEVEFAPRSINAQPGSNVLTLRRVGGGIPWPTDGSVGTPINPEQSYIHFDYHQLDLISDKVGVGDPPIKNVGMDSVTSKLTLTWASSFGEKFDVLKSTDLQVWTIIETDFPATGAQETSYDFTLDSEALSTFFRVERKAERISKPNIIFLFADDFGYGDLGCYGHPYAKTPNLDQFATEGTRFNWFNVTGLTCNPSRTGYMTSRSPDSFPHRTDYYGFQGRTTLTELLKGGGYRTGHFGKWHIGPSESDGTYGIDEINVEGGRGQDPMGRDQAIYEDAMDFIEANKDVPFYMNVWGRVTHSPVDPRPDLVTAAGFDDLVLDRNDFEGQQIQVQFDQSLILDSDLSASMANYVTEVYWLDFQIGRLLQKLDDLGLRDNTLVIFSSDQGPATVNLSRNSYRERNLLGYSGGLKGQKHDWYEGGIRVPFIVRWPGMVPVNKVNDSSHITALDLLPTYCDIAGISIDGSEYEGEVITDILLGSDRSRFKPYFTSQGAEHKSNISEKGWKVYTRTSGTVVEEVYNLHWDVRETRNLVGQYPEIEAILRAKVQAWKDELP